MFDQAKFKVVWTQWDEDEPDLYSRAFPTLEGARRFAADRSATVGYAEVFERAADEHLDEGLIIPQWKDEPLEAWAAGKRDE